MLKCFCLKQRNKEGETEVSQKGESRKREEKKSGNSSNIQWREIIRLYDVMEERERTAALYYNIPLDYILKLKNYIDEEKDLFNNQ